MALSHNVSLTFKADLNIGDYFILKGLYNNIGGSPTDVLFWENWVLLRNGSNKVTTGTPTLIIGERTAINFVEAFNLDFSAYGFTISRVGNKVSIFSTPASVFGWAGFSVGEHTGSPNTYTDITVEYFDGSSSNINITSVTFSQADSEFCSKVNVSVQTDVLAKKIISPISIENNLNNPFNFEWLRGETINIRVENEDGIQNNQVVTLPSLLNPSNFDLIINNSPNGGTVIVENQNINGLVLEYSIDNVNWQNENVFASLAVGNYTLFVKDQFGCSFSKTFSITEFGVYDAYFPIMSKSNSIRFASRITWGDSENYKTDENTLSYESDVKLPYQEVQQFQSADVITTQFKSNYSNITATVIKEDNSEVDIPIVKNTNNIGVKDKRDARKYDLGNGRTGVYFLSGNIYNYVSGGIIGTYALNGLLPEWGQIGNYITIDNAWFFIEDIVYDENKGADVIVISEIYTGPEINIIAGSIFNRFNYEVYEFVIDMVSYINQYIQVRITGEDPHHPTVTFLSELLWIKVKHENVLEIKYYNSTNTDILYSTGIQHLIRIPYISIQGKIDEDSEVHKTDTTAILLNADLFEMDEFVFEPVTKEIWRKIMLALSHETVTINGVGYVKNGEFQTDGPLGETNLYALTATMIKTGSVYNSQTSGGMDFNGSEIEVPGLINTDSGFLKY